ncbi:glucokinase [Arthrobacter stackebrandtii]|uniref:Glucokinase n=1 Tax=Arthrobacter stackebrandtii TaxID=272161 RepID=A0ABS4YTK4_9MICC|nr:ROK family protein [Arthrobacter stackebrandtii]MBP2412136.1 glucokinase [Arthrobacter stackebrandtii]PYH01938.1 sugar kinase [Arthrobacter stackebrandtii]
MRYVVGVDLGGTKTAAGVVAEDGSVLLTDQIPTLNRDGGEAILDATAAMVRSLMERAAAQGATVDAIGVGSAGVINAAEGTVISATDAILGWTGTAITAGLSARLGLPSAVVNDVHAHALGEAWKGAGHGAETALMVAFGTGVGGSFVVDGKPLLGHRFVGGHVGHFASPLAVHDGVPLACSCGHAGHVEAVASGPAIHAAYVRNGGNPALADTRAVFDAARAGDSLALSVIATASAAAGQAVGGLINILDPAVVVVSGGLADAGELWWSGMDTAMRAELLAPLADVPVVRASLGNTAAMVGAASLVLHR